MALTCFSCGTDGHTAAYCPNKDELDQRPTWCGRCDRRTRQIWLNHEGSRVQRCPECHPTPSKPLAQHKRCPACKMLVHEWDTAPCDQHSSPVAVDRRPDAEQIRHIVEANS